MKRRNIIIIGLISLIVIAAFILAADFTPQGNINLRGVLNITNVLYYNGTDMNITGTLYGGAFSGPINWTFLQNYPIVCPGSGAITLLGDSVTCSDLWVDVTGDAITGNLNISGNLNVTGKITNSLNHILAINTEIMTVGSGGVWYNITFNNSRSIMDGMTLEDDNVTFIIVDSGGYNIDFGMGFQDGSTVPDSDNAMRIALNGEELINSIVEADIVIKKDADIWLAHFVHADLIAGDKLNVQYISSSTNVIIKQDDTYTVAPFNAFVDIEEIII